MNISPSIQQIVFSVVCVGLNIVTRLAIPDPKGDVDMVIDIRAAVAYNG